MLYADCGQPSPVSLVFVRVHCDGDGPAGVGRCRRPVLVRRRDAGGFGRWRHPLVRPDQRLAPLHQQTGLWLSSARARGSGGGSHGLRLGNFLLFAGSCSELHAG